MYSHCVQSFAGFRNSAALLGRRQTPGQLAYSCNLVIYCSRYSNGCWRVRKQSGRNRHRVGATTGRERIDSGSVEVSATKCNLTLDNQEVHSPGSVLQRSWWREESRYNGETETCLWGLGPLSSKYYSLIHVYRKPRPFQLIIVTAWCCFSFDHFLDHSIHVNWPSRYLLMITGSGPWHSDFGNRLHAWGIFRILQVESWRQESVCER